MKNAIIGTGIAGLGAAYLPSPHHDVTLYEKNGYIGGHSRTIEVETGNTQTPVDTGFIVFNDWNYPNLMGLFHALDVPYEKSDMSFGVSIDNGWLEYASGGLFAQRKNWIRPAYYKMLFDIIRFNKQAPQYIDRNKDITLGQCLDDLNMGDWFRQYYLLAMGAAIWSCPVDTIMKFPAHSFLRFFKNHGLLNLVKRPQWYTVTGGSHEYTKRLTATFKNQVRLNCGAMKVETQGDHHVVHDENGNNQSYDAVIFACHADEALAMIDSPTNDEQSILGCFGYQENTIIVHSDTALKPHNKKCWASWVYLSENQKDDKPHVSLSYWMNNLQNLNHEYPIIVTLNPDTMPDPETVMDKHVFSHPVFDDEAVNAKAKKQDIQGKRGLWFCGAYQRYGFHEDGLLSAVNVAKSMGVTIPWDT